MINKILGQVDNIDNKKENEENPTTKKRQQVKNGVVDTPHKIIEVQFEHFASLYNRLYPRNRSMELVLSSFLDN